MGFALEKLVKQEKESLHDSKMRIVYAPRDMWHGSKMAFHSDKMLSKIELGRLDDFLEYLFEHSEHCNHIAQSEAWKEFEQWELKQAILDSKKLNP